MKSLKRTLCLVLALVMVLGLFGIASATNFTDDNTIQYKEAVDVMTGIGAINGMGDGTFNPKGTITRAQAAKLVTYAVLGQATAERLTGVTSHFTDVTVEGGFAWAIPSIEYLVSKNIINGMGDGTFNPNGEISGIAVLKMLLCSLGRGAKDEYVGTGWDLQVTLDANNAGLTTGRASNSTALSAPATREEVALYCLNTIQKTLVEYVPALGIYRDVTYFDDGTTKYRTIQSSVYPELVKAAAEEGNVDTFGNPANEWTYKDELIATAEVPAAITLTTAATDAELTKMLNGYKVGKGYNATSANNDGTWKFFTDGVQADASSITDVAGLVNELKASGSTTGANSGNGTVIKIFADKKGAVTNVTVVNTDFAQVTTNNAATGTIVLTKASLGASGLNAQQAYTSITKKGNPELYAKLSALPVETPVLVTPIVTSATAGDVAAVSVPQVVTGKVVHVTYVPSTTTVAALTLDNGTTYKVSASASPDVNTAVAKGDLGVTLLLDSFGYVVHYKADEAVSTMKATNAFIVRQFTTLEDGELKTKANVVLSDGTVTDVVAVKKSGSADLDNGKVYPIVSIDPVTSVYTLDGDKGDHADFTVSAAPTATKIAEAGKALQLAQGKEIKAGEQRLNSSLLGDGAATPKYYNNLYAPTVKFVYVSSDDTRYSVTETKTGVQDVTTGSSSTPASKTLAFVEHDPVSGNDYVACVLLINPDSATTVDTTKLYYFAADTQTGKASVLNSVTNKYQENATYTGYMNGEEISGIALNAAPTAYKFYNLKEDTRLKNVYTLVELKTDATTGVGPATGTANVNDPQTQGSRVHIGGNDVNVSNAAVYDIRDGGTVTTPSALLNALKSPATKNLTLDYVWNAKTGAASIIYVRDEADATMPQVTISAITTTGLKGTYTQTPATATGTANVIKPYGSATVSVAMATDTTDPNAPAEVDATKLTLATTANGLYVEVKVNGTTVATGYTASQKFEYNNTTSFANGTTVTFVVSGITANETLAITAAKA